MADLGFGLPVACAQYQSRVMGKALAGVEVLASAPEGFLAVMEDLNAAQYIVAKALLGAPHFQSVGSRVAVLSETRILTRAGTEAATRVVTARARLACLREDHPVARVVQGILASGVSDTWLDHSRQVMAWLGVSQEFWEFVDLAGVAEWDAEMRKGNLRKYRLKVVKPAALSLEVT